ncbi:hypothetical protein LTR56_010623 [Elasticomyces elasticus]|nr:hypothetical protein LTR56_010623 [Elasticomyces elasticus]KAK4932477.1 hypothetical protein LTR49_001348 [Elasticomyces elasticus]KAK5760178.1 hypothetical protein LTS12_009735 [Elasticomyces elasticus]
MDDPVEAKALIEQICRSRGVDSAGDPDENAVDLEHSLSMLSEELYSTPTHFILELIQNADDNKYHAGTTPQLTMVYHEAGYLWIGCNEIGFSVENVRAICRINRSTKKVLTGSKKGYIGEKGIGFKSVFTVADQVWIKSGALSFMFDSTKPLGMVAPLWTELPQPQLIQDQTVICLQIPLATDRDMVMKSLLELKPELLVFLRQLRSIRVEVRNTNNSLSFGNSISRSDSQVEGVRLTTINHTNRVPTSTVKAENLLVFEQAVSRMPLDEKRLGVTETEVLMAFPVNEKLEAVIESQDTFAFLPICSYGLPFLLQGDFILTGGREAVKHQRPWNTALIKAALDLFMSCVSRFNATGLLKYNWPEYAQPKGTAAETVFHNFFQMLGDRIKLAKVLESRAGTLEMPGALQWMPSAFTDENGGALLTKSSGPNGYVSPRYNKDSMAALRIGEVTPAAFCKLLEDYAKPPNGITFQGRSAAWHAKIAEVIMKFGMSDNIRHVKMVPLHNGQWVTGNTKPLFFADHEGASMVPRGIDVAMIASNASANWSRRKLYQDFGAVNIDIQKVFKMIVDQHNNAGKGLSKWKGEDVLSHALFLFNAPPFCSVSGVLVGMEGFTRSRPGQDLYMDVPGSPFRVSELLRGCKDAMFINKSYLTCTPPDQTNAWLAWLQKELKVNVFPKLRDDTQVPPVTKEFRWMVEKEPSANWLVLLRDHWDHYSREITTSLNLKAYLSNALVSCTDGRKRPLKEVYLPAAAKAEPLAAKVAHILAVSDPEHASWVKLTAFGLSGLPTTRLYLDILKSLSSQKPSTYTLDDVKRIYTALRSRAAGDGDALRKAFRAPAALVYIPLPSPAKWVSSDSARWTAPSYLTNVHALRDFYPDLQTFFTTTLGVRDTNISDVVDRLLECSGQINHLPEIKSLLVCVSRLLTPTKGKVKVNQTVIDRLILSQVNFLPVRTRSSEYELRSISDRSWFFADSSRLLEGFGGKVPLLDFDMVNSAALVPLIEALGLTERKLSKHIVEETEATGEQTLEPDLTDNLKAKAKFIQFLVPLQSRESTLTRLASLQVYSAQGLVLRRKVVLEDGAVYGQVGFGQVAKTEKDGKLIVFVSQALVKKGVLPPKFLASWLSETFAIDVDKQKVLLEILDMDDEADIKEVLEREGMMRDSLPPDTADDEDEDTVIDMNDVEPSALSFEDFGFDVPATTSVQHNARAAPTSTSRARDFQQSQTALPRFGMFSDFEPVLTNGHTLKTNGLAPEKKAAKTNGTNVRASEGTSARQPLELDREQVNVFKSENKRSTLQRRSSPDGSFVDSGQRLASTHGGAADPDEDEIDPDQLVIGMQGEQFVFRQLTKKFGAPKDCWTSSVRTEYGHSEFEDNETFYTDFTISDRNVRDRITSWLRAAGHMEIEKYAGKEFTYRIEVKTTSGTRMEPFSMSGNQYNQARMCHESNNNAYVILRVYDIYGTPEIHAYVNPYGQEQLKMKKKKLSIEPVKYSAQPLC